MAAKIRSMSVLGSEAGRSVGYVEIALGDFEDAEQSTEWITARMRLDEPTTHSLALLQIAAVRKARDLLTDESDRLSNLYQATERSQR